MQVGKGAFVSRIASVVFDGCFCQEVITPVLLSYHTYCCCTVHLKPAHTPDGSSGLDRGTMTIARRQGGVWPVSLGKTPSGRVDRLTNRDLTHLSHSP